MRFRVTAVQDSDLPAELANSYPFLEDWLNRANGDADFGCAAADVMLVVFATASLPKAPAASRLIGATGDQPTLALHVVADPVLFIDAEPSSILGVLSAAIVIGLPEKPLRKPKGLDYGRLRTALVAAIAPFAQQNAG